MSKRTDKVYAMSSFLMFRTIANRDIKFRDDIETDFFDSLTLKRIPVKTSKDLDKAVSSYLEKHVDENTGMMLSGGIDSAILASYMPKGSKAYTLKAIAPNAIDETQRAKKYADYHDLEHEIVEIYWEDYEKYSEALMRHKGAPIHSIEVQIYKAALQAKRDGLTKLVYGESADALYGGLDGLLSEERTLEDMLNRYTYVMPPSVLTDYKVILDPYMEYLDGKHVDVHKFISKFFFEESVASYINACSLADIEFVAPYVNTEFVGELDLDKIRNGNSKYIIRDLFKEKYPDFEVVEKIPMPRPMGEWLKDWTGPERPEFIKRDYSQLKPDQKWLVYILERFLELYNL